MSSGLKPISVFISYAPKDEKFRSELETHLAGLRRQKVIEVWHRGSLVPGADQAEVDTQLRSAEIILLLISANFLADDLCFDYEMVQALEQARLGRSRTIPILVQSVVYAETPFAKLAPLPRSERPIATWDKRDEAWVEVVKGIRQVVDSLRVAQPPPPKQQQTGAERPRLPTNGSLRSVIDAMFLTAEDLEMFVVDNFPELSRHFGPAMGHIARVNVMLQIIDKAALLNALAQSQDFGRHKHLLKFDS